MYKSVDNEWITYSKCPSFLQTGPSKLAELTSMIGAQGVDIFQSAKSARLHFMHLVQLVTPYSVSDFGDDEL